jgi:D-aminopeptidase
MAIDNPVNRKPETNPFQHLLVIADIEGSSGCGSYRNSSFLTRPWARACAAMSRDVNALVKGLFSSGVRQVTVQDFHRTGYNLLPEMIDSRARIVCGYRRGPIPGLGKPQGVDAAMMIGMHAAAGTDGFLAHTLTSRLVELTVNGRPLAEVELFAAALAPFGIPTIFFSGCPVACAQAEERIAGIQTLPIDKRISPEKLDADRWRKTLARAAAKALTTSKAAPYDPAGPCRARIRIHDAATAARMAGPWGFDRCGAMLTIDAADIRTLYDSLIRLCYLSPLAANTLPLSLALANLVGRLGRLWVRRQLRLLARD